jgi:molybdopterin molybdotransferase
MIRFDEAIAILRAEAVPLGIETTRLAKAGRRVLAEPVHARLDAPRYDAAAMDGFAIIGCDGSRSDYTIVGTSYPGQPWHAPIGEWQAVRIMTGAAVPERADCVIPIELAEIADDRVHVSAVRPTRDHIRRKGSDVREGQIVLTPGTMLGPRALLVAATADVAQVRTWRRPVVGVIASGDELRSPGQAAEHSGAIPDSLSEALLLLARQYDAKPGSAMMVSDNTADILAASKALLESCDILVLVGGASRGDRDFAKAALTPLDLRLSFADVAMKPGKPVWYGRVGGAPYYRATGQSHRRDDDGPTVSGTAHPGSWRARA